MSHCCLAHARTTCTPARRPRNFPAAVPLLAVLALLVVALAGLLYYADALTRPGGLVPTAAARAVTPRGELVGDEQGTIDLFKAVSPSVVHVTNLSVQRDPFSLN